MARSDPPILAGWASKLVRFCLPFSWTAEKERSAQPRASASLALGSPHRTTTKRRDWLKGLCSTPQQGVMALHRDKLLGQGTRASC